MVLTTEGVASAVVLEVQFPLTVDTPLDHTLSPESDVIEEEFDQSWPIIIVIAEIIVIIVPLVAVLWK